jgi:hypothetical protein
VPEGETLGVVVVAVAEAVGAEARCEEATVGVVVADEAEAETVPDVKPAALGAVLGAGKLEEETNVAGHPCTAASGADAAAVPGMDTEEQACHAAAYWEVC